MVVLSNRRDGRLSFLQVDQWGLQLVGNRLSGSDAAGSPHFVLGFQLMAAGTH
jgi:hypothetical protein